MIKVKQLDHYALLGTQISVLLLVSDCLSKRTTDEGLGEAFAKFGEVLHARATDRGHSKGFGFVRYATLEEAAAGIAGMDGKFLDGWVIFAEYSRPKPPQKNGGHGYNTPQSSRRY